MLINRKFDGIVSKLNILDLIYCKLIILENFVFNLGKKKLRKLR